MRRMISTTVFGSLLDQVDPHILTTDPTKHRDQRLCGLWLTIRRLHLELNDEIIREETGIDAQTLFLLGIGRADETLASNDAWEKLCAILTDGESNFDWIAAIMSIALGQSRVGSNRIMERVMADLLPMFDQETDDSETVNRAYISESDTELDHPKMEVQQITPSLSEKLTLLRKGVFSRLRDDQLRPLANNLNTEIFAHKEIIFQEKSLGNKLYIIVSGRVRIYTVTPNNLEATLDVLHIGDIFGDLAMLDGQPRIASAQAIDRTTTLTLERGVFLKTIRNNSSVAIAMLEEVGSRLRAADRHIAQLGRLSPSQRILSLLTCLVRLYGETKEGMAHIDLRLKEEELAQVTGTTPAAVIRTLTKLHEQGIIDTKHGQVTVVNLQKLERLIV